ncbi:hypothetical protein CRP01_07575 [Flavilitoribacter nigricans DSM 23189 = NBRC 102662]|uniref:Uncharacterized protein n=1 Tax=Flavilitoribacter nigricans (strain ATCC 23147 / DSM 23189 / NBRC 102662 / NCIMB 1420 / SS-2) TaxID=1122177 RepID=A0A2D0NH42_FLAN2|nr:hypothetical protein CRP01_07575 [Flavilitoribacter nigricans DSM 23189 = NBRC 102662]
MRYITYCILILTATFCLQCDIINPEETVPAFLYIEPFSLQTDELVQGSASEKITEVWVTVNDEFLGAYQLPATVPVLMSGEAEIFLEAGIKDNGIGSTPEIYPFYQPYETTVTLMPDQTTTISPTTSYSRDTRFALIENFESGTSVFRDTLLGNSGLQVSSTDPFEGSYSGKIRLSADDPVVELATIGAFTELTDRSPFVYLEVNYQSDAPVIFGLAGGAGTSNPNIVFDPGFNPKASWNKIYFNLSALLATSPYDSHKLALRAFIPTEDGQLTLNNATVCLDNIKLVHF